MIRTRFAEENGNAFQVIGQDTRVGLVHADLSPLTAEERERELARRMADEADRPFDLRRDLMLRAQLLRCGEDDHVLLLTMHHIASDGWSVGVLCHELGQLYCQSELAPLAVQYADYACWQRDWLQGAVLDAQLGYWKRQLDGVPQVHSLPLDRRGLRWPVSPARCIRAMSMARPSAGCAAHMAPPCSWASTPPCRRC